MVASRGTCPECGSSEVTKERIMGAQTGDLICLDCKFSGSPSRFSSKSQLKEKEE
ncbi:Eag protein [Vibrio sp. Vb0587]|uniref:Eag protein n=1 Tax=Vibrio sp. Vb0587 TaxID=3074626 RepID=UPI00296410E3|nr:Eag protein [Vibrio sp. Vb0587]MDW1964874.1 Eag protein [Vibrio sp. Vb0587]